MSAAAEMVLSTWTGGGPAAGFVRCRAAQRSAHPPPVEQIEPHRAERRQVQGKLVFHPILDGIVEVIYFAHCERMSF